MVCRTGLALLVLMLSICWVEAQVSPAAATGSGSIVGKVTDPSPAPGAPIPGAQVTVTDESSERECSARADSNGSYRILGLVAGNYRVRFASRGFKTEVRNPVHIEGPEVTHSDVTLTIGGGGPHVEVTVDPASKQASAREE